MLSRFGSPSRESVVASNDLVDSELIAACVRSLPSAGKSARELCGVVGGFMEPVCVVVYQNDPSVAQVLAVSLSQHFQIVHLVRTCKEVRPAVARHRAEALVLDLETSGPDEVDVLHREFPDLCIVGTHRLADDKLWAEAMSLGASDICEPRNDDVVRSLLRSVSHRLAHHAAA